MGRGLKRIKSKALLLIFVLGCALREQEIEVIPSSKVFPEMESRQEAQGIYHRVQKGETLYRISQLYGVELSRIIQANRITAPHLIKEGQLIYIPEAKAGFLSKAREEKFIWPLQGRVVSKYGSVTSRGANRGIDIVATSGRLVKASKSGIVSYAGEDIKGYGKVVIIEHGDKVYTLYAYNSKLLVKKGDRVFQNQPIAMLKEDEPVLHFEIRKGHRALNPLDYLSQ